MKIIIVTDKRGTAIDRLALGVQRCNPQLEIEVLPVHPKRPDPHTLHNFLQKADEAQLIDYHYWKTGQMLLERFNHLKDKPSIVVHHNPYDVTDNPINDQVDRVVVVNQEQQDMLPSAPKINLSVDLDKFIWNPEYTEEKVVGMVAFRIEGKKGIKEVALACEKLGYRFLLIGNISDGDYFDSFKDLKCLDFRRNVTDEQLVEAYKEMAVLVVNSQNKFETGTLPVLEAMAIGIPILSRPVGHVPELNDGKNMVINEEAPENVEALTSKLQELVENREWRLKLRENAWQTVKNWGDARMARKYRRLYSDVYIRKITKGNSQEYLRHRRMVSIIIPTCDKPEALAESLLCAVRQTYKNCEVIVVDDSLNEDNQFKNEILVKAMRKKVIFPITYLRTGKKNPEYGLAKARNIGAIEAVGDVLIFCDDRINMKENAVEEFMVYVSGGIWLWGIKDGASKGFVENFSAINRNEFIKFGMFCERMTTYGGMTQETRTRFEACGMKFTIVNRAEATANSKSRSSWTRKSEIIKSKDLLFKMYGKHVS